MDNNTNFVIEKRVAKIISALEKNNMNGYFVEGKEALYEKITSILPPNAIVSCGGSMTLFETGVIEFLRKSDYSFLDRYKEGISPEEIKDLYRESFAADAYFVSTNAITEAGELYNVDGTGNRVAAMLYGPEKVVVVCGTNKIVKDLEEAKVRLKTLAAPANSKRISRKTPCTETGYCSDCNSLERICREYTVIKSQGNPERIHVIFVKGEWGY